VLDYVGANELAAKLRGREISAVEALDAFVSRVAERDPALNAVVSLDVERARRLAVRRDAVARPTGPLHGVPMTIKDAFDVAGLRTTIGTPLFDHVPTVSATVTRRLEEAGAIIVGHSNVPAFLADYVTDNDLFGRTNNPWAPDRTPGGSGGGAAAALAAGITPIEFGSDLAGSLRLPPHFCGVYGLKATELRVPVTGFFSAPHGGPRSVRVLNSLGPMARDLDDLDLVLRVVAGPDGVDVDVPPVPLPRRAKVDPATLRLAVSPTIPGVDVSPSLRRCLGHVADGASDVGARVTATVPAVDFGRLSVAGDLIGAITQILTPAAAQLRDEQRSLAWYLAALDHRDHVAAAFESFFADHDALVLPAGTTTAFSHDARDYADVGGMLVFANLAGLPVLTVPAGADSDGLPIGAQIVGPRWSEPRLLDIAAALEDAGVLPGFRRPPGY